jgi:hypothetical protein
MPSLENLNLSQQATALLANARRDLLASASEYKGRLDRSEFTAAYVRTLVNSQGTALVALLQRVADHQAPVEAALLEWQVSVNDTRADYTQLRTAAETMRDATAQNVATVLTQIIAQVPAKTRLF